jgi:2-polyprenyl-6-methoxyphenol hydroxylase-like FAD-dependent oxidoreductase
LAERYDVLVIGGGLAGASLAIGLCRQGWRVAIVEKGDYPRDKVCGEFLSPESVGLLSTLGVWSTLKALGPAAIGRARFCSAGGKQIELALPGEGQGVSRRVLDQHLVEHAVSEGAALFCRAEVEVMVPTPTGRTVTLRERGPGGELQRRSLEAGWVIGAYGRRARIDHLLDRPFASLRSPFVGLKRHHRPSPRLGAKLQGHVEIHTFDGGYCGMSFVEGGVVNVCMLLESRVLGELDGSDWSKLQVVLQDRSPSLRERWAELEPCGEALAVAQVPFFAKETSKDGVLFVGDAAGVIAPLAGDGQAMALESGLALADLLGPAARTPDPETQARVVSAWDRAFRRRFRARLALAQGLQRQLLQPSRAELVFAVVGALPGAPELLARWTRGKSDQKHGAADTVSGPG